MKYILFDWQTFLEENKLTLKQVSIDTDIDKTEIKLLSNIGSGVLTSEAFSSFKDVYSPDTILKYLDKIVGRDE
jgi:hypothetical protein